MKKYKQMSDSVFGGALALQSTELLKDRSTAGLTRQMEGFVSIGITGALANQAFKMAQGKKYKYKKRSK